MWGVTMEEDGNWYRHIRNKHTISKPQWRPFSYCIHLPKEAYSKDCGRDWTESNFSRDEIIQRWEEENAT